MHAFVSKLDFPFNFHSNSIEIYPIYFHSNERKLNRILKSRWDNLPQIENDYDAFVSKLDFDYDLRDFLGYIPTQKSRDVEHEHIDKDYDDND